MIESYLHILNTEGEESSVPALFTFPFEYTPHPLCIRASEELKTFLRNRSEWSSDIESGKMFGVLVVRRPDDPSLYYLAAFSGIFAGSYHHAGFVPPVYDLQRPDGHFCQEEIAISNINHRIAAGGLSPEEEEQLMAERKQRSRELQQWTFRQFRMLNAMGERVDLLQLFANQRQQDKGRTAPLGIPPSGSGECCAPKLLQFAYLHGLQPLCMAEFWMGRSPVGEVRHEGKFYPACRSKCRPILTHMLRGLNVEPNPLLERNRQMASRLRVIYKDEWLVIVDKPSGMLAVPGKDDVPSVESCIRELYPEATGPLIVHRLDMDTSGIMVIALDNDTYHALQEQFVGRTTTKRYVALLDGIVSSDCGTIDLPLARNPLDRPRQMVSHDHGKRAITEYRVLDRRSDSKTLIEFIPHTGRTHQLRVHAAHTEGLGCPIVGDNLYGNPSSRLCLHAQSLSFSHPHTGQSMVFESPVSF